MADMSTHETKCCTVCHVEQPVTAFHRAKRKNGTYGVASLCKACSKAKVYAYRAANPEKHAQIQAKYRAQNAEAQRESNRRWVDAHPKYESERYRRRRADPEQLRKLQETHAKIGRERRAIESSSERISPEVKALLLAQPCAYCWATASDLDHVVPLSSGGRHDIDNIVPACRRCNARKSNKSLLMFLIAERRRAERSRGDGTHR